MNLPIASMSHMNLPFCFLYHDAIAHLIEQFKNRRIGL